MLMCSAVKVGIRQPQGGHTVKRSIKAAIFGGAMVLALHQPAWAIYNQSAIITNSGSDVPITKITFTTPSGAEIPVEQDDDDDTALMIVFPGNGPSNGTLIVEREDGSRMRIAVPTVDPGNTIEIDLANGTAKEPLFGIDDAFSDLGKTAPRLGLSIGGMYVGADLPGVGAGTVIGPNFGEEGNEEFAAFADSRIDMVLTSLAFDYQLGESIDGPRLSGIFAYGWGDDDTSSSIPSDGEGVGIVYHDFAPSGSTGIFLGPQGLDVSISRELEFWKARLVYDQSFGWGFRDLELRPRFGAQITHTGQDIVSVAWSPNFGDSVRSTATQELDETIFSLIVGVGAAQFPKSGTGITAGFTADALINLYNRDLNSMQSNICGVCPASDQAFDVIIEDNDDGFSVGAELGAHIGYQLSPKWTVGLQGKAQYLPNVGQIVNTRTGDDLFVRNQPTALGDDDAFSFGVGAFLSLRF